MPLFRCTTCGSVDNTGLTNYYQKKHKSFIENQPFEPQCSECETGVWHGQFEKKSAEGMYLSERGYLFTEEQLMTRYGGPSEGRILGRIGPQGEVIRCDRPKRTLL